MLVMEYAAGGELYDYLSERKVLSEQEARRIFRQIATAVFYCHKHKICHRDLKLENILLDQAGNAKIADFGLSNVFDEQRLLSTFCGSPLYASPEIVKGTPYHGPEVDCWSLGVLLYTLVYGAMPFDGSNFKRLVKQISQSDYFEPKKPSREYFNFSSSILRLSKDLYTLLPSVFSRIAAHKGDADGVSRQTRRHRENLHSLVGERGLRAELSRYRRGSGGADARPIGFAAVAGAAVGQRRETAGGRSAGGRGCRKQYVFRNAGADQVPLGRQPDGARSEQLR